jgi:hypothetical protein
MMSMWLMPPLKLGHGRQQQRKLTHATTITQNLSQIRLGPPMPDKCVIELRKPRLYSLPRCHSAKRVSIVTNTKYAKRGHVRQRLND